MYMHFPYRNSITQGVIVEDDATQKLQRFKNQNSTHNFISELSRKLNNFRSHFGITKVIGIRNIAEIGKGYYLRKIFCRYTCTSANKYYEINRVCNAIENIELL